MRIRALRVSTIHTVVVHNLVVLFIRNGCWMNLLACWKYKKDYGGIQKGLQNELEKVTSVYGLENVKKDVKSVELTEC